jgi:hypothetical protein
VKASHLKESASIFRNERDVVLERFGPPEMQIVTILQFGNSVSLIFSFRIVGTQPRDAPKPGRGSFFNFLSLSWVRFPSMGVGLKGWAVFLQV